MASNLPKGLCATTPMAQNLPASLMDKKPREIVAYICKGYQCSAPITSFDELVASL